MVLLSSLIGKHMTNELIKEIDQLVDKFSSTIEDDNKRVDLICDYLHFRDKHLTKELGDAGSTSMFGYLMHIGLMKGLRGE